MLSTLMLVATMALPDGFAAVKAPTEEERTKANGSPLEWQVARSGDGVAVTPVKERSAGTGPKLPFTIKNDNPKYTPQHVLALDDGYLVGSDQGEWGGAMVQYTKDGRVVATLAKDNTHGIVRLGDDLVSLHGLNHMMLREGSVRFWKAGKAGVVLAAEKKLDAGPGCFTVSGATLWVVTPGGLTRVTGREVKQVFATDVTYLYPNSVVVDAAGDVWAGMRFYVLHLKKRGDGFDEEWLIRK